MEILLEDAVKAEPKAELFGIRGALFHQGFGHTRPDDADAQQSDTDLVVSGHSVSQLQIERPVHHPTELVGVRADKVHTSQ